MCSLGIEPTTFCAADAMLYHWATLPLYHSTILRRFWLCRCCLTFRHWSTTAVLVASMHWCRLSRLYTGFLSSVLEQMILTFPISCKHLDLEGPQTMIVPTHSPRQTGPHRSPPSSSCFKEKNSQLTLKYSASQNCWFDTAKPNAKLSFHFKTYKPSGFIYEDALGTP